MRKLSRRGRMQKDDKEIENRIVASRKSQQKTFENDMTLSLMEQMLTELEDLRDRVEMIESTLNDLSQE